MGDPIEGATTDEEQIELSWAALTGVQAGGIAVTSYHLQWDKASSGATWYDVQGNNPSSLSTSTILTSEVQAGETYQFRVRARNIHGWGDYSNVVPIKAAGLPDQVASATTSIDPTTGGVVIQWVEPHDGSQTITEYLVEVANVDATSWHEDSTNCDGSDPAVTSCTIPMDVLVAAPHRLVFD